MTAPVPLTNYVAFSRELSDFLYSGDVSRSARDLYNYVFYKCDFMTHELAASIPELSQGTGYGETTIRDSLGELANLALVDLKKGNGRGNKTIIRVRHFPLLSHGSLFEPAEPYPKPRDRANPLREQKPSTEAQPLATKPPAETNPLACPAGPFSAETGAVSRDAASPKNFSQEKTFKEGCEFEDFWREYPRQEGRHAAEGEWQKLVREGEDPAVLLAASKRYAEEREGEGPQFTRLPKNFLAERDFEDYAEPKKREKPVYQPWEL